VSLSRAASVVIAAVAAVLMLGAPAGAHSPAPATKYYIVPRSSQDGPVTLFLIAQQFLGDGNRYQDIVVLNEGRLEPDGDTFGDPMHIDPGWILILPADAHGYGVHDGPPPPVGGGGVTPSTGATSSISSGAPSPPPVAPLDPVAAGSPPAASPGARGGTAWLVAAGSVVVLIGAGLLVLLLFRTRWRAGERPIAPQPSEPVMRAQAPSRDGATPVVPRPVDAPAGGFGPDLDRALRALCAARAGHGAPAPQPFAVTLHPGEVALRFAPADERPPAPWHTPDRGRTWLANPAELPLPPSTVDIAPIAAHLVTAGTAGGAPVLVNLGRAVGLVELDGDPRRARRLGLALASELASAQWSRTTVVTLVGFGDAEDAAAVPATYRFESLDAMLRQRSATPGPGRVPTDATSVMVLRGRRPGSTAPVAGPELVVIDGEGTAEEMAALSGLVADPSAGLAAVVVGPVSEARWRCLVDAQGAVVLDVLGIRTDPRQ
jgi:hypothetical protein